MDEYKEKQLKIILEKNPVDKSLGNHTWVESTEDIHTFQECCHIERATTPDFFQSDINKALDTKRIKIYSSHPITQGAWVTPSKMEARNYAGGGTIYDKEVFLDDVAWIDTLQGMYASVKEYEFDEKMKENSYEIHIKNSDDLDGFMHQLSIFDLNHNFKKIPCYIVDKDLVLEKNLDLGNCIIFCNNIIGNNYDLKADVIVTRDIRNLGIIEASYIQGTSLKAKKIKIDHDTTKYDLNDLIDLNRQRGIGNSFQIGLRDQLPPPINLDFDIVIGDLFWQQESRIEPYKINLSQEDWIVDEGDCDRVGFQGGKVLVSKIEGANGILAGDISAKEIDAYNIYSIRDTGNVVKLNYGGIPKIEDRENCVFDYVLADLGNVSCNYVSIGERGQFIAKVGEHKILSGANASRADCQYIVSDYACVDIINCDVIEAKTVFAEHLNASSMKTNVAMLSHCNCIDVEVKDCIITDNANIVNLTLDNEKTILRVEKETNIKSVSCAVKDNENIMI